MKRALAAADASPLHDQATHQIAREAAVALLDRSIRFHHRRLAVLRIHLAAQIGAPLRPDHWVYCQTAAEACTDARLLPLLQKARTAALLLKENA